MGRKDKEYNAIIYTVINKLPPNLKYCLSALSKRSRYNEANRVTRGDKKILIEKKKIEAIGINKNEYGNIFNKNEI